jgi:serine/threonine-protein kinase HipA
VKSYKKKYKDQAYEIRRLLRNDVVMEDFVYEVKPRHKCLFCYKNLEDTEAHYHEACNKKFYQELQTPLLNYKLDELDKLAKQVLTARQAVTGVQAKVSLSKTRGEDNFAKKLTIVGMYGHYILKPPSKYYLQLPEVEDVTMHLAEVCGLPTVPHTLVYLNDGTRCYLTKRVDRTKTGMLHMEDFCQLSERLTEDKYKGSYEQVAKLVKQYSATPLLDVSNYFELVLFCFLTGNADMHLKNFSLLENQKLQGYTLSPAYDLVNTALVNPQDPEELALTLNGKKRKLNKQDFYHAYLTCGLSAKSFEHMLENYFYCVPEMLNKLDESFLTDEYKSRYKALLKERAERVLL